MPNTEKHTSRTGGASTKGDCNATLNHFASLWMKLVMVEQNTSLPYSYSNRNRPLGLVWETMKACLICPWQKLATKSKKTPIPFTFLPHG